MSEKFGEKLRRVRTDQNVTLEGLADAIGSSKAYVWQLENKKNAKPSAALLLKISNFLGQSPDFFLDDAVDEATESQLDDALFRTISRLSEDDKRVIEKVASSLRRGDKESDSD